MEALYAVFLFVFGLVIGSFLNVVIYRYNTGRGIGGRSACMSCGKVLRWYELLPVLSWAVQRGRCRGCGARVSAQYALVELATGLAFLLTALSFARRGLDPLAHLAPFALALASWSLLVVIFVYDLRHKIIPDGFVYAFAAAALFGTLLLGGEGNFLFWAVAAGPILFLPFWALWAVSGGRWIGLGDGKLALGMGWMLGLGLGVSAVIMGFWIGAAAAVAVILAGRLKSGGKRLTMKSEIPFAPFLVLGLGLAFFFGIDVLGLHALFGL